MKHEYMYQKRDGGGYGCFLVEAESVEQGDLLACIKYAFLVSTKEAEEGWEFRRVELGWTEWMNEQRRVSEEVEREFYKDRRLARAMLVATGIFLGWAVWSSWSSLF